MTGLLVLIVALVLATGFGLWRRRVDGRIRTVATVAPRPVADDDPEVGVEPAGGEGYSGEGHSGEGQAGGVMTAAMLGAPLGAAVTLVQFSTAFCQPCRATRRILDEVAQFVDGVAHVEIDAEAHLNLVRQLDIRRTPTTLILDAGGVIAKRATGVPRKVDVIAAIGELIGPAKDLQ